MQACAAAPWCRGGNFVWDARPPRLQAIPRPPEGGRRVDGPQARLCRSRDPAGAGPAAFYLTDHYRPYPAILVRLSEVPVGRVTQILEKAWRFQAPKSLSTS